MASKETTRIEQRSINWTVLFLCLVWAHALFAEFIPLPNSGMSFAFKVAISLFLYSSFLFFYFEPLINHYDWDDEGDGKYTPRTVIGLIIIIVFGYFSVLTISAKTIPYFETMFMGHSGGLSYSIYSKRSPISRKKRLLRWICPGHRVSLGIPLYSSICDIQPGVFHKAKPGDKLIIYGKIGPYGVIPKYYSRPGSDKRYPVK